ncbi:hypothetical protein [Nocardia sp. NPDC057440]|uniref:hypothetical protein n=1 Tax=Nocardia sp. NPDC057440 TaxID=3346134 RepID=UPI003670E36B
MSIESALLTAYRHTEGHQPNARIDINQTARRCRSARRFPPAAIVVLRQWRAIWQARLVAHSSRDVEYPFPPEAGPTRPRL